MIDARTRSTLDIADLVGNPARVAKVVNGFEHGAR
jgi:hypothetical protein